jgi:hypothetical protein
MYGAIARVVFQQVCFSGFNKLDIWGLGSNVSQVAKLSNCFLFYFCRFIGRIAILALKLPIPPAKANNKYLPSKQVSKW